MIGQAVPILCPDGHQMAQATCIDGRWTVHAASGPLPVFYDPAADGSLSVDPGQEQLVTIRRSDPTRPIRMPAPTPGLTVLLPDVRRRHRQFRVDPFDWPLTDPDLERTAACTRCQANLTMSRNVLAAALVRRPRQLRLPAGTPRRTVLPPTVR